MTCTACGQAAEPSAQFCSHCGKALRLQPEGAPIVVAPRVGQLVRPREGRMIAGVCAGFALRYGWDLVLTRLVLLVALVFGIGTPLLAYVLAWIVMPIAPLRALPEVR